MGGRGTGSNVATKIGSGATPRGGERSLRNLRDQFDPVASNIYDYQFEFSNLAFINPEQAAQLNNVIVEARDVLLNITGAAVARCSMVLSHILACASEFSMLPLVRASTTAAWTRIICWTL